MIVYHKPPFFAIGIRIFFEETAINSFGGKNFVSGEALGAVPWAALWAIFVNPASF